MDADQLWSWLAAGIGLIGFWLNGNKYWWAWWVNVVNQLFWVGFALVTGYYAFLITAGFYTLVFGRNAIKWTREHQQEKARINDLLKDPSKDGEWQALREYAEKDVQNTMKLFQGDDALKLLGLQGHSHTINDGEVEPYHVLAHILRLDDKTPICHRPSDSETFVLHAPEDGRTKCIICLETIKRWNDANPFGLLTIEGKPDDHRA